MDASLPMTMLCHQSAAWSVQARARRQEQALSKRKPLKALLKTWRVKTKASASHVSENADCHHYVLAQVLMQQAQKQMKARVFA